MGKERKSTRRSACCMRPSKVSVEEESPTVNRAQQIFLEQDRINAIEATTMAKQNSVTKRPSEQRRSSEQERRSSTQIQESINPDSRQSVTSFQGALSTTSRLSVPGTPVAQHNTSKLDKDLLQEDDSPNDYRDPMVTVSTTISQDQTREKEPGHANPDDFITCRSSFASPQSRRESNVLPVLDGNNNTPTSADEDAPYFVECSHLGREYDNQSEPQKDNHKLVVTPDTTAPSSMNDEASVIVDPTASMGVESIIPDDTKSEGTPQVYRDLKVLGLNDETRARYELTIQEALKPRSTDDGWKNLDAGIKNSKLHYKREPGSTGYFLHMVFELDATITECCALGCEVDLWPTWNPVVTKNELVPSETEGVTKKVGYWEKSVAGGILKAFLYNVLTCFYDYERGVYIEHVEPAPTDAPYFVPQKGTRREQMVNYFMMIPIDGGKRTMWISMTTVDFGFAPYEFLAKSLIPKISSDVVLTVKNNVEAMKKDNTHGKLYQERIKKDTAGVYKICQEMIDSANAYQQKNGAWNLKNIPTVEQVTTRT